MENLLRGWTRSHMAGVLTAQNEKEQVTLMGWVHRKHNLGNLIFVLLRDITGVVQLVFDAGLNADCFATAETLKNEYVITVKGQVTLREEQNKNPRLKTGDIEIMVSEIKVLSRSEPLPFPIDDQLNVSDSLRYQYRYLDLRRPCMQKNLILRHRIVQCVRQYLNDQGFLEMETPMLTKSTPEGARDYLVPSRVHPGEFYALPQSPQLFKQILMLSGYDKYYQIARCFRDEDLRADRQPEFTQIDMEMSFVDTDGVMAVVEGLIQAVVKTVLDMELSLPVRRITYQEAMDKYGSDKPDLRFEMPICDIGECVRHCAFKVFTDTLAGGGIVRAITAKGGASFSRKEIDALTDLVKTYKAKGLAWIALTREGTKSSLDKYLTAEEIGHITKEAHAQMGDMVFIVADTYETASEALGQLRLALGKKLNLYKPDDYRFVWVTEFPLLEFDKQENRYVAKHHPFTAPMDEDLPLLLKKPLKVRAKAYDIVLNGTELGGGSVRIHSPELQEKMFGVLGFSKEQAWSRFGFLLKAFQYGPPPHGGLALGLDRLIMLITGADSIRDVIAFPKMKNAACLMTDAPSTVDDIQLKELSIAIKKDPELL